MKRPLLTPSTIPTAVISRCLVYPDSQEWRAIVNGLIAGAIDSADWQPYGEITEQEAAERCLEMAQAFFEAEECNPPGGTFVIGEIKFLGFATAPAGFLICDGAEVSRSIYADLFGAIGTTYGTGDDSTTFNLPDFSGRSPMGAGTSPGGTTRSIGDQVGADTHTLTIPEMPAHHHAPGTGLNFITNVSTGGTANWQDGTRPRTTSPNTADTGGGTAHNNIHPVTVVQAVIYSGVLE